MNNLFDNATRLPSVAKIVAVNSYVQFLNKYSIVSKIKPDHWDFIISVAGVFVAVSQLNHEDIAESDKDTLLDEVTKASVELYTDFLETCDDCRTFVDRTYDGLKESYKGQERFLFSDSLGSWITWNLFGHSPDNKEERELVRALGAFIVHSFFYWWK